MSILEELVQESRCDLESRRAGTQLDALLAEVSASERSLEAELSKPGPRFIMECKRASPSMGTLRGDFDAVSLADEYAPFAAGISVITHGGRFQGSLENLSRVSRAVECPVLCKAFIVDPYQVVEARYHGADAVLLMLSVLDDAAYDECARTARELGLDVLTEVHDHAELERALALGARIIGINNRNLRTLEVDLEVTERLARTCPTERVLISESGIRSRADVDRLAGLVDGFLVGSSLVSASDVGAKVRELVFGSVKICGLTNAEDAAAAYAAGATYGGLIFAESPRKVTIEEARQIVDGPPMQFVGVFANAPVVEVSRAARELGLSAVQLHGNESDSYLRELTTMLPPLVEIWDVNRVCGAAVCSEEADRTVFETHVEGMFGGTGKSFDWAALASLTDDQKKRSVLAGGIDPSNASRAFRTGVGIIDICSGVEGSPGLKDHEKLKALFDALERRASPSAAAPTSSSANGVQND